MQTEMTGADSGLVKLVEKTNFFSQQLAQLVSSMIAEIKSFIHSICKT